MEHKLQLQLGKSSDEGEAMAASSSSTFFSHPFSLLHHVAHSCAGYLRLSRLFHALKDLKPRASTAPAPAAASELHEDAEGGIENPKADDDCVAVQVRSRGMPQRPRGLREGRGGNGGGHH